MNLKKVNNVNLLQTFKLELKVHYLSFKLRLIKYLSLFKYLSNIEATIVNFKKTFKNLIESYTH